MDNSTAAAAAPAPSPYDYDTPRLLAFWGLAAVLPAGLLGNALCFAVFLSSRSLRKTTTGHYLVALAVADSIFLSGELIRWLNSFTSAGFILGLDFMETSLGWCLTTFFLRYAGKLASAWITVAIAGERFLTVAYPLRVARISTPFSARIGISVIYVACFLLSAFPFWTIGLKPFKNSTYCGYTDAETYHSWNAAVLRVGSLLLPAAIIFLLTVLILFHLRRASRRRHRQLGAAPAAPATERQCVDAQLTRMLVGVAVAFLVLRLPYTVTFYVNDWKEELWPDLSPGARYAIYFANKVCDVIAISNYAVNFFLYCLCGSAFRSRFSQLFLCPSSRRAAGGGGRGGRGAGIYTSVRTMSSRLTTSCNNVNNVVINPNNVNSVNNNVNQQHVL